MAEFSIFHTTGTSGDGATAYTQTQVTDAFRDLLISDNYTTQGVLVGNAGELAVTGTSSPVSVNTGAAVVYGFIYRNTTASGVAIPTPVVGTTGHTIALRADYAAHTVRITRISSADGVATPPALTQIANTTWDIPLATLTITTGGVITVTDARSFAHFASMVATENIDNLAVTTGKLASSAVTAAKLDSGVAGNGLTGGAGSALAVVVDNSTVEISADTVQVKDAGITAAKLATDSVVEAKIQTAAVTSSKLAPDSVAVSKIQDGNVTLAKLAPDSVDDTKAGDRVPQFYRRKGGSASVWQTAGTTDYTPTAVRMQAGAVSFTANASTTTTQNVTFPVAFSQAPLVYVSQQNQSTQITVTSAGATSTTLTITVVNYGAGNESMTVNWFAVGPE